MKLAIILNTNDPETAWNVLRLAHKAVEHKVYWTPKSGQHAKIQN